MCKKTLKTFLSIAILIAFSSCASIPTQPPLPSELHITPPESNVPSDIAHFSGAWEGKWGGSQNTIIVIEKINTQRAEIIKSVGSQGAGGFGFCHENSYENLIANVLPGPKLEWTSDVSPEADNEHYSCPCKMTLEIDNKSDVLIAIYEYINYGVKFRADLKRK